MPVVHEFDPPERFVAGTVGLPGERSFYLQARAGNRLISVTCEKQQVAVLAERMDELLDRLMDARDASATVPAVSPIDLTDNDPLDLPIEPEFRAGTMTLSWDPDDQVVAVEVFPFDEDAVALGALGAEEGFTEPEADELLLVRLTPAMARAFVKRTGEVLEAGRPSCPFCARPIDPDGHLCVRANGFKRRSS